MKIIKHFHAINGEQISKCIENAKDQLLNNESGILHFNGKKIYFDKKTDNILLEYSYYLSDRNKVTQMSIKHILQLIDSMKDNIKLIENQIKQIEKLNGVNNS